MKTNMPTTFVEAIRVAIKDSGLTFIELASRSSVDEGQLSRFQNGKRSVTVDTADKILAALGLAVRLEASKPKRAPTRKPKRKGT